MQPAGDSRHHVELIKFTNKLLLLHLVGCYTVVSEMHGHTNVKQNDNKHSPCYMALLCTITWRSSVWGTQRLHSLPMVLWVMSRYHHRQPPRRYANTIIPVRPILSFLNSFRRPAAILEQQDTLTALTIVAYRSCRHSCLLPPTDSWRNRALT